MAESPLLAYLDDTPPHIGITVAQPDAAEPAHVEGLLAGAAEVDITPPPGMPKSGHSRNAIDGTGFRTRLRARVLHLREGRSSVALVATDLHAGSAVVRHLVAQAVAEDTDVRLDGLFLGATHTHAGPGQFHGCDFYNRFASNRPGFDPAFAQFLVERISGAVREAVRTRRPALLAAGTTDVWGFTRNRSLDAHVRNDTVADKRLETQRRYAAINPALHLLRVDAAASDGGHEPLAALAVFSIHGTGISRHDPAYNADVWAYIVGELAHRVESATGRRIVAGAIEGTHGDMTPAVRPGMLVYPEAERVGRGIGEAAAALHARLEADLRPDARVATACHEIDLDADPVIGGVRLPEPFVGAAKLAGARENATPLLEWVPPFRAGWPKPRPLSHSEHGAKWVFGTPALARRVAPTQTFPRVLPLHAVRAGPLLLVGVPFEVTVEAGRRLETAVAAAVHRFPDIERVAVSSTVNDYWDYLTTPEEYARQCYEGASTLYGPATLRFVSAASAEVAAGLGRTPTNAPGARTFRFQARRYLPRATGGPVHRSLADPARFHEATPTEDAYWEVRWRDGRPGDLAWHEPMVRVEALDANPPGADPAAKGGWPVDDQGWHVGVAHLGADPADRTRHLYAARWYGPPLGRPGQHRFVILAGGQDVLKTAPFD